MVYIQQVSDAVLNTKMKVFIQLTPREPHVLLIYALLKRLMQRLGWWEPWFLSTYNPWRLCFWNIDSSLLIPCSTFGVLTQIKSHKLTRATGSQCPRTQFIHKKINCLQKKASFSQAIKTKSWASQDWLSLVDFGRSSSMFKIEHKSEQGHLHAVLQEGLKEILQPQGKNKDLF